MKSLKAFFIIIFLCLIVFFLVSHSSKKIVSNISIENVKYVEIGGQKINVDLALTEGEQAQGLSGRQSLSSLEGMLFVFNKPDKYLFWMKDMNFPIDMIWINQNMKVIFIKENALPVSYPETYGPSTTDGDAKYVLEVVAGFSEKNNLKTGDSVLFF